MTKIDERTGLMWIDNDDPEVFGFAPKDDEVIFRNYKSFHVNRDRIGTAKRVYIVLMHRKVIVMADAAEIREMNWVGQTRKGEVRLHYPIVNWKYVDGDKQWLQKIYKDNSWNLPPAHQGETECKQESM